MERLSEENEPDMPKVNLVRVYLEVLYISDLSTTDGLNLRTSQGICLLKDRKILNTTVASSKK